MKKMIFFLQFAFVILFVSIESVAQDTTLLSVSILEDKEPSIVIHPTLFDNEISQSQFNRGLISDPLLLIQGRMAGVQVNNRGGDPNVLSLARVRGVSSLDFDIEPLIIIDGVPNASIESIDPNDIESITVHKDGFAQSRYGARGANGVIVIKRKLANPNSFLNIQYNGGFGVSSNSNDVDVLDAPEFVINGGADLGSDVDYLSEIKRTGLSRMHGLSFSKGFNNISVRLSGNYRNTNGILKRSGFDQINGSAGIHVNLLNNRLNIRLNGSKTEKNQNLSFVEAFKFAAIRNPTFPILGVDSPFTFNEDMYGGYFESVGLFDSYNPVAMIELNDRINRISITNFAPSVSFELFDGLELGTNYAYQKHFSGFRELGGSNSFYRGEQFSTEGETGRGVFQDIDKRFSYSNTYVQYGNSISKSTFLIRGGYTYQKFSNDRDRIDISQTNNKDLVNVSRILDYSWVNEGSPAQYNGSRQSDKLIAFYNNIDYAYDGRLFVNFGARYEGSSLHAEGDKWHFYPSMRLGYDLGQLTNVEDDIFLLSGSFGMSSSRKDDFDFFQPHPNFLTEIKREFNFGLNYKKGPTSFQIDLYRNTIDNVNFGRLIGFDPTPYGILATTGMEVNLGLDVIDHSRLKYTTSLFLTTYRTKIKSMPFGEVLIGNPGAPGFASTQMIRFKEGEEYGQFFAPVFKGVNVDGFTEYEDVNNDGQILIISPQDPQADFSVVGHAMPDFELGWAHDISVKGINVSVLFRGAFGHSLVNLNRMFYESNLLNSSQYNSVVTSKAPDGLNEARYSSLYVEDASFVKLDNLSVSKSFYWGAKRRKVDLSLMGQNLLTITGYTGVDPEPSLIDRIEGQYFTPGIDRRINYRPSRAISVGLKVDVF